MDDDQGGGAAAMARTIPIPPKCGGGKVPMEEFFAAEPVRAEMDEDGFVVSFALPEQEEAAIHHMRKYGFVVIRDVLTSDQCQATINEFWEKHQASSGLDVTDPDTWEPFFDKQRFGHLGIMGGYPDLTPMQLENRQNPKVYQGFSAILDSRTLCIDHDRLGLMRPTVNVAVNGDSRDRPEWRTRANWLHLDCNPIEHFASIGGFTNDGSMIDFDKTLIIQALITLTDARVEDGGYHCVPGGHTICQEWSTLHQGRYASPSNMQVVQGHCGLCDKLHERIQEIPIRAGCLLMWSSLLFHGNHPNMSERFRACQYIRAMPTTGTPYTPLFGSKDAYPNGFVMSDLGKKLFGLEKWEEE